MNTAAWIMILVAFLIARGVYKGRVMNLGEDLSDAFLALIKGDTNELTEVLARTGDSAQPNNFDISVYNTVGGVIDAQTTTATVVGKTIGGGLDKLEKDLNGSVALAAVKRGEAAKGYKWTATGPDYYDCSGLIWRACQDVGYKGARFTTYDIATRKGFKRLQAPGTQGPGVDAARVGDIIVWPTKHMGVITAPGRYYSARSVKTGIGESSIEGTHTASKVIYLRYVG